jgi:hypothetical protein
MDALMTTTPLAQTLAVVATELADMAVVSDRLQALISDALLADGAAEADHVREF